MIQTQINFKENQKTDILNHLKAGKSISTLEALNLFGCFRLGARIYDLKQEGYFIRTEIIRTPSGKSVASYSLNKEMETSL